MDQNPSGESERGPRAGSVLYLCLLLQWNVLRALFTAEALLHTSYSFCGSCGGCRNNEIIIPIIPSDGGNETAFVPCSRLHQLGWFCSTSHLYGASQDISAEAAPGRTCNGTKTIIDRGYPHMTEIPPPREISAYPESSMSPLPSKHTPCPTWVRIVGKCRQQMGGN